MVWSGGEKTQPDCNLKCTLECLTRYLAGGAQAGPDGDRELP